MPEYRNIPLDAPCYSSVAEPGGRVFCVTVDELIECGLSENYLYKGLSRQRSEELSCWSHHKEGRVVYIHYDGLKPNYQALIRAKLMQDMQPEDWFNQHGRADWIMKRLQPYAALNPVDETYLDVATYPNGEKLTPEARAIASESCRWLGMFVRLKRKQDIKAIGYTSVTEFYDDATFMFAKKGIQLPTSYVKLRRKIVEYERVGASCCVDLRGQSNKNAAKVYNEEQTALLRSLCGRGASYNCQQVADLYNTVAKEKGWEEISRRSALNYLREYHLVVKAGRDGSEAL